MTSVELEQPLLGGTDGWRAIATDEPGSGRMNREGVAGMTYAFVGRQLDQGMEGPVVVARDTRASGGPLSQAAIAGALAQGVEVIDLGVFPTPAAQRFASKVGASVTAMLTASHNPAKYNGLKLMIGNAKPDKAEVRSTSNDYWKQVESGLVIPLDLANQGRETRVDAREEYIQDIVDDIIKAFPNESGKLPLEGKFFVVDGANGAAMGITPEVFERLGARVERFCCDGSRPINENCGAARLDGLKEFLASRPDITSDRNFIGAIANDGDADRFMGIGLANGRRFMGINLTSDKLMEITGNHVMEAMAKHPRQPGVVGTIYTNSGMTERLQVAGIDFEYCDNGDTYVTNALLAKQAAGKHWTRGGEFTGHLIDTEWLTSGDGVHAAAWFAAWAVQQGATFGDICKDMPMWPEEMLSVELDSPVKGNILDYEPVRVATDEAEAEGLRSVTRASGTEPVVRVWVEGKRKRKVQKAANRIATAVRYSLAA
jgi:phosphoglucosamine mutase